MKRMTWVCLLFLAGLARSDEPKLPEPPRGFSWKKIDEIKAALLLPEGWHYRHDAKDKTTTAWITREKIEEGKPFKVGLSVKVLRECKKPTAKELAQAAREEIGKEGYLEDFFRVNRGKLKGIGGCCLGVTNKVRVRFLVLTNPAATTLYVIQFESPEKEWEEAWKLGKVMLEKLVLDDDV